jgi:hypothetical protein
MRAVLVSSNEQQTGPCLRQPERGGGAKDRKEHRTFRWSKPS